MQKGWLLLMNFQWNIFIAALGLALILEGLPYFLGPDAVKKFVRKVLELPPSTLRLFGLTGIIAGLTLVALSRLLG
jgi:uncharacterized protein YjeT (DUF2065 family)